MDKQVCSILFYLKKTSGNLATVSAFTIQGRKHCSGPISEITNYKIQLWYRLDQYIALCFTVAWPCRQAVGY